MVTRIGSNSRANSDAAIVSGLIALLLRVYSNRSAREILDTEPEFIQAIGLSEHLSPTRANGLDAMLRADQERRAQHARINLKKKSRIEIG